jgi:hypothetical protein
MTHPEATPPTQELPAAPQRPAGAKPPPGPDVATQRRYRALAAAICRHEQVSSHPSVPKRPADHALYRDLAALEEIPPIPGDEPR